MRLQTNRGYLYILVFLLSLAAMHFTIHLLSNSLPQLVKYAIGESNHPLKDSYGGFSVTYMARYISVRYLIYPALLCTFLIDHFNKEKWLNFLSSKMLFALLGLMGISVTIISQPKIEIDKIPLLAAIRFPEGSGFYIYAIITWILLIVLSYGFLKGKLPKHHALWITLLLFLSIDEVWEYSPFLRSDIISGASGVANVPLQLAISNTIWRAAPSFLLLYYIYRFGSKPSLLLSASLALSIFFSLLNFIATGFEYIGVSLRVLWAATYILLAHNLSLKG